MQLFLLRLSVHRGIHRPDVKGGSRLTPSDAIMKSIEKYFYGNLFTPETNLILEKIDPLLLPCVDLYVNRFYEELMGDDATARFLTNEVVEKRLKSSLVKWLNQTLSPKVGEEVLDSLRTHQKVGEVHARIEVPMSLVDSSMTIVKEEIFATLINSDLDAADTVDSVVLVNKILDAALSLINESYLRGKVSNERTSQEYVSASSAHELALEIERVKNNIYNWMTRKIVGFISKQDVLNESVHKRDFGLWIKHKYPLICGDDTRLAKVHQTLGQVESLRESLVESKSDDFTDLVNNLTEAVQELIWLLTDEADSNIEKESKQDTLTSLLERRFLDPIMQQETKMAMQAKNEYSLMMIDLDNFKRVNDLYGHQAGDKVLSMFGRVIKEQIRLTDYAFRYGGEEVLVLFPEMGLKEAVTVGERIRANLESLSIEMSPHRHINVTASLGIAVFKGHPDYQKVINEADGMLYEAKRSGRNCLRY